jgi:hypothetical protein
MASCTKARATKGTGVNVGRMPAEGCGVDAGGVWRILEEDAPMWGLLPSLRGWRCHRSVGQPFIRRSPHMMGFGHVPTGSISDTGHTEVRVGHGVHRARVGP